MIEHAISRLPAEARRALEHEAMAASLLAREATKTDVISAPARMIGLLVALVSVVDETRAELGLPSVPTFQTLSEVVGAMNACGDFEDFDPATLAKIVAGARMQPGDALEGAVSFGDLGDNFADPRHSEDSMIDVIDSATAASIAQSPYLNR